MPLKITGIDHLVLTVSDVAASVRWYSAVLGMKCLQNGGRWEAHFGSQKINFHACPGEFLPAAANPAEGSADICLTAEGSMQALIAHFKTCRAHIIEGPVPRSGAKGLMQSVYLRDPDGNLIEVSVY